MFVIQPSIHIISNLKEILATFENRLQINNESVIHLLKVKLCKYFQNQINNSYPELKHQIDDAIDGMLPVSNEQIQEAVNSVVNQMMDEIKNEINLYLNNQLE